MGGAALRKARSSLGPRPFFLQLNASVYLGKNRPGTEARLGVSLLKAAEKWVEVEGE